MKAIAAKHLWVISILLYTSSWVWYGGPNLSFLAWIAFVPLFIYQERHQGSWWRFLGASYGVIQAWTLVSSGWLFHFPTSKWLLAGTILSETLHISVPFLLLYGATRMIGYRRALWLLPFIWPVWEWLHLPWEHTIGTHLLPYGQGSNVWLIQISDLGGMWMISTWVLLFNVITYKTLKANDYNFKSSEFLKSFAKAASLLIIPVLLYFLVCSQLYKPGAQDRSIQATMLSTQFPPDVIDGDHYQEALVENSLHHTDSIAFHLIDAGTPSQLFVWPESGTKRWQDFSNIASVFQGACDDWSASFLTGCAGIPINSSEGIAHVSGAMISPYFLPPTQRLQYHHKTRLLPVTETTPYAKMLGPILYDNYNTSLFYNKGRSYTPLQLTTEEDRQVYSTGVSICYEQWHPSVWINQVREGAEFMVHIAQEGWYGNAGFAQYMANVCRMRAVESRRSVARSSNSGITTFISPLGYFYNEVPYDTIGSTTGRVMMSSKRSLFSRFSDWYIWVCMLVVAGSLVMGLKIPRS